VGNPDGAIEFTLTPKGGVMADQEKILRLIALNEGGEVNAPADRGGHTNFGITAGFLRSIGDPRSPSDLTWGDAKELYTKHFLNPMHAAELPDDLALVLVDGAVNHGIGGMTKRLQELLADFGWDVQVDGGFGPATLQAALECWEALGQIMVGSLIERRRNIYKALIAKDPRQEKFHDGWWNRLVTLCNFVTGSEA